MKKVALLGGSHFIGVHLLHALYQQGHEITLYNRNLTRSPVPYPEGIKLITGDRNKPEGLSRLFKNDFDIIFDLSGFSPGHVEPLASNYRSGIGQYIFCSTPAVYKLPLPVPLTENAARIFEENTYGGDKALVENLLLKQYKENHWPVTIFRPQGVFGPYDPWHAGFVFYRLMHSLPIFISSKTNFRLNPLYIDDLVNAFLSVMGNSKSYGAVYGVAGDDVTTPLELVKSCGKISSCKPDIKSVDDLSPYKGSNVTLPWLEYDMVTDCNLIKSDLGLEFTSLNEALEKTFTWIKKHPASLKRYSFRGEKYVLKKCPVPLYLKLYWFIIDLAVWSGKKWQR